MEGNGHSSARQHVVAVSIVGLVALIITVMSAGATFATFQARDEKDAKKMQEAIYNTCVNTNIDKFAQRQVLPDAFVNVLRSFGPRSEHLIKPAQESATETVIRAVKMRDCSPQGLKDFREKSGFNPAEGCTGDGKGFCK